MCVDTFNACIARGRRYEGSQFNRARHLAQCAKHLEQIRAELGNHWPALNNDSQEFPNKPETKKLVKHLIRTCSESVDFYATVDFMTTGVCTILQKSAGAKGGAKKAHLRQWSTMSHEHMVPGEVILKELLQPNADIQYILNALSFRALVTGPMRTGLDNEVTLLDQNHRTSLPSCVNFNSRGELRTSEINMVFYPMLRYEVTGLVDQLIPLNERAETLLSEYNNFKKLNV